jgi:hypothetical protein
MFKLISLLYLTSNEKKKQASEEKQTNNMFTKGKKRKENKNR